MKEYIRQPYTPDKGSLKAHTRSDFAACIRQVLVGKTLEQSLTVAFVARAACENLGSLVCILQGPCQNQRDPNLWTFGEFHAVLIWALPDVVWEVH